MTDYILDQIEQENILLDILYQEHLWLMTQA